jgi:hypothetical protein
MKKVLVLFLLVSPCFASLHYVSQTLKPTASVVSYPVRHPVKTAKGFGKGVAAVTKTVF